MKISTLIILLFSLNFGFSQTFNVPFRKGTLWGYADNLGKIIIEPKYDSVSADYDNFRWYVFKNGKTGIINIEGIERIPVEFDSIHKQPVHSEYNEFEVYKNGQMGYTDINGKFILPVAYKSIYKADDESFNRLELKFFVQTNADEKYQLITQNKTEILKDIEDFKNIYNGYYIIQTNKKNGIYSMISKSWKINAEYDSIKRFDYKDFYRPKEEFKNIKYYGLKSGKIYLFTNSYEIVTTSFNKIEDFFYKPENNSEDIYSTVPDEVVDIRKNIIKVTGDKYVEYQEYKTKDFNRTQIKISISKEKEKYKIKCNNSSFDNTKKFLFDEICLLKSSYDGKYDSKFALVKSKNKWQFFNIIKNELISNITFDSYDIHKRFNNILLLKNKNKIGLYQLEDGRDAEISAIIEPIYDSFENFKYITSNDREYHSFNLYYFKKNGKLCPVGMNGIKFYQD